MNPRLIAATTRRVLQQLLRDRRTLALVLVVPAALLVLISYVFDNNRPLFDRISPMLLVIFPMFFSLLVASVSMQRERTAHTLERILTTRIRPAEIMLGYLVAFTFLCLAQAVVLNATYAFLVEDASRSPWWFTMIVAAVSGTAGVALGLFGSAFARTEFQAVQVIPVLLVPQIFLCGLFTPRAMLPRPLEILSNVMPLSFVVEAHSAAASGGVSAHAWLQLGLSALAALLFLACAGATMRRSTPQS